ncbi:hypothetical protein F5884DRAFT_827690 [Xylogone sp. PMI_703]|nr:hypothetical protein F5884DRAFT_827690 [Xylogone sp. PMI_703]
MPLPSAGCQTCKLRRIKCDEAKPICQRCFKSRRICVEANAAKQTSFSIHLENTYASGKNKRPRGPRASLPIIRPYFDLQTCALAYYLQYHLQMLTDKNLPMVLGGLSECVYTWRASMKTSPMVELALSVMALAIYARTQRYSAAATEASLKYHRLLRVARKQIAEVDMDEETIDACILSIFLMARYEAATNSPDNYTSDSFDPGRSWNHHDGTMAMLRVWKDRFNYNHRPATTIVKQARRGFLRSALLRRLPLPSWLVDGEQFGESHIELEYDRIFVRAIRLHYELGNLQQGCDLGADNAEKLSNEAIELNNVARDWEVQLRGLCYYEEHALAETGPWPKTHVYSPIVYSYPSPGYAAIWIQHFAIRMLIYSTQLRLLDLGRAHSLFNFTYESQRLECLTRLEEMSCHLASSIPFSLERFKIVHSKFPAQDSTIKLHMSDEMKPYLVYWIVWPLTIVSSLEKVDNEHKRWFKSELASIGRITGDGGLTWAETDQWPILL